MAIISFIAIIAIISRMAFNFVCTQQTMALDTTRILGIMAVLQKTEANPFGRQTQYFEDMVRYYKRPHIRLIFFSPYAWKTDYGKLEGLIYENGLWHKEIISKPTLVYDRTFSRDAQEKDWLATFRSSLKDQGVTLFNPIEIQELSTNKQVCTQWQASHGFTVLETTPLTDLLSNPSQATGNWYLKPKTGSRGIGVMKLQHKQGQYRLSFDQNSHKEFYSVETLTDYLKASISISDYIAQEEAQSYNFRERPYDLRLMVQQVDGQFTVTGEAIRLGKIGSIVSNLSSGGSAIAIDEFQKEMDNSIPANIPEEIDKARKECVAFANRLMEEYGRFAELGFDVLLTRDKGPVILEVNAKPSRWVFVQVADHEERKGNDPAPFLEIRKQTVLNPLAYAESVLGV